MIHCKQIFLQGFEAILLQLCTGKMAFLQKAHFFIFRNDSKLLPEKVTFVLDEPSPQLVSLAVRQSKHKMGDCILPSCCLCSIFLHVLFQQGEHGICEFVFTFSTEFCCFYPFEHSQSVDGQFFEFFECDVFEGWIEVQRRQELGRFATTVAFRDTTALIGAFHLERHRLATRSSRGSELLPLGPCHTFPRVPNEYTRHFSW
mmetsp:Transcript_6408/g.40025  ORF Transcript_6408/g.40025 Transcript_6408/m.40025 type:complete len:202 (+) Transcript_6408:1441-2046(+)